MRPQRLVPELSYAARLTAALILMVTSSCSTLITKTTAARLWSGRWYIASRGLGHPFTGIRCEPLYFAAFGMYPPTLPLVLLVVADAPLSGIADVLVLPADIAIHEQNVWDPDRDCGINLH